MVVRKILFAQNNREANVLSKAKIDHSRDNFFDVHTYILLYNC